MLVENTILRLDPHTLRQINVIKLQPGTTFVAHLDFYLIARTPAGFAALDLSRMRLNELVKQEYQVLKESYALDNFAYDLLSGKRTSLRALQY